MNCEKRRKSTLVCQVLLKVSTDSLLVREWSTVCWNVANATQIFSFWLCLNTALNFWERNKQTKWKIKLVWIWFECDFGAWKKIKLWFEDCPPHIVGRQMWCRCVEVIQSWVPLFWQTKTHCSDPPLLLSERWAAAGGFQFCLLDQNLVNLWFGDKFGKGGVALSRLEHSITSTTTKSSSVLLWL